MKIPLETVLKHPEYAAYYLKLHDERKAAREEGHLQTQRDNIRRMTDLGLSLPQIASLLGMTEAEAAGLLAETEDVTPDTEA